MFIFYGISFIVYSYLHFLRYNLENMNIFRKYMYLTYKGGLEFYLYKWFQV